MRILVITQALDRDDDNQGAFYPWWQKLARCADRCNIIGLRLWSLRGRIGQCALHWVAGGFILLHLCPFGQIDQPVQSDIWNATVVAQAV